MGLLYKVSVVVHILSVVIWLGGLLFFALVVIPLLRKSADPTVRTLIVRQAGQRFSFISWICLISILITGFINLSYRGDLFESDVWSGKFGHILLTKLFLFGIVLLLSVIHDFKIGPKALKLADLEPNSVRHLKYRKFASWIGRINAILATIILILAVLLIR